MRTTVRARFFPEAILAALCASLFVYSLFTRDWIELVFKIDPDQGTGYLEWLVVAGLLALTFTWGYVARREWRRTVALA